MPRMNPGYTRNTIRRCFRELVDPSQSPNFVWQYFESSCAYCGIELDRLRKEGHIDHLVPAARGGSNHISNRVLSCANCNENEKGDKDWEPFLKTKCADPSVLQARQARIKDWIRIGTVEAGDEQLVAIAEAAAARVIAAFDVEVESLRRTRLPGEKQGVATMSKRLRTPSKTRKPQTSIHPSTPLEKPLRIS